MAYDVSCVEYGVLMSSMINTAFIMGWKLSYD